MTPRTVIVTGAAKRLGAAIACVFHDAGYQVVLHYRDSADAAAALTSRLNGNRPNSAVCLQANLLDTATLAPLIDRAVQTWGTLDVLVNNASAFYPTPFGQVTTAQWEDLVGSNLRAPFFLAQACAPHLRAVRGSIVNLGDIHAERMLKDYPVYSIAKAAVHAMTRSLAKELAPEIRVNGVAPGAILWPEASLQNATEQQELVKRIPLGRVGTPDDIARTVLFLADVNPYITGQTIAVDGGRTLDS